MTADWYVTCRFTTTRYLDGEAIAWPSSTAHAKRMGGQTTACGENSGTWSKLFLVPFPPETGTVCALCAAEVRSVGARETQ